jgi:alkylation response protein AidB-like acyl-CoA dehydrogenase
LYVGVTEEQALLRDAVEKLGRSLGRERSPSRWEPDDRAWDELVAAGLIGIRVPEEPDAATTHGVEAALVAESLGRHLVNGPFIGPTVALELLTAAGGSAELVASVATGRRRVAPVLDRSLRRFAGRGEPGIAWDAGGATVGVVVDGRQVAVVALGDDEVPSVDLTRRVVAVDTGDGEPVGSIPTEALARAEALMLVLLTADLVGTADGALTSAVEYAKSRRQFGKPIGSFQAVQHRCADCMVSVESARSIMWYAAWALDEMEVGDALLAARVAKAWAAPSCLEVCESVVQVHGGIGMTWENLSHVYLRRAHLDRLVMGDEERQLDEVALCRLGEG